MLSRRSGLSVECPVLRRPDANALPKYAEFVDFKAAAASSTLVPLFRRVLSDHLTPVLAYRCLVKQDDRDAPSFLLESVVNGNQSVRPPWQLATGRPRTGQNPFGRPQVTQANNPRSFRACLTLPQLLTGALQLCGCPAGVGGCCATGACDRAGPCPTKPHSARHGRPHAGVRRHLRLLETIQTPRPAARRLLWRLCGLYVVRHCAIRLLR